MVLTHRRPAEPCVEGLEYTMKIEESWIEWESKHDATADTALAFNWYSSNLYGLSETLWFWHASIRGLAVHSYVRW